jgi:hypothetical protein
MIETITLSEVITELALAKQKCVMYFKPVGLDTCKDVDKINTVWNHYSKILPPEILYRVKNSLHNFAFFDNSVLAVQKMEEWFPFKGEMPDEYYVYVNIVDADGNCVTENESLYPESLDDGGLTEI